VASRFKQGLYEPTNIDKYVGKLDNIVYRSSWELVFMQFLDNNPNIKHWASEPFPIMYVKPTDGRVHRYFPDFFVEYEDIHGNTIKEIVEVKPASQTKRTRSRNPKTKLYEDITYAINIAKWKYAQKWCDENNMRFNIITEHGIFK
jgi:hypothetical protein